MKLSDLIPPGPLVYPRGLAKDQEMGGGGNQVKPEEENVKRIEEAIRANFPVEIKLTYNTKTKHIIDGMHRWIALRNIHGDDWDIPNKYLNPITIAPEDEWKHAIAYNCAHGLTLGYSDMKVALANHLDESGKLKYGGLKELAEMWNMSIETLKQWVENIRYGPREIQKGGSAPDSSDIKVSDKEKERLETEIIELRAKMEEVQNDAREYFFGLLCPPHKEAFTTCKNCGR